VRAAWFAQPSPFGEADPEGSTEERAALASPWVGELEPAFGADDGPEQPANAQATRLRTIHFTCSVNNVPARSSAIEGSFVNDC
jgi:hypothetical protein